MRIPVEGNYRMFNEMVVKWEKKKPICILELLKLTAIQ